MKRRFKLEPEFAWNAALETAGSAEERERARETKRAAKGPERKPAGDPADVDGFLGPWAGFAGETMGAPAGPTTEQLRAADLVNADGSFKSRGRRGARTADEERTRLVSEPGREKTVFHGAVERADYQGRTYMHVPTDSGANLKGEPGAEASFVPKRLLHTWSGHPRGTAAVRLFPGSGHLLLSAGMDGTAKLWDVYRQRACLRTCTGHGKAIRDTCFTRDGTQFLTASYDKYVKIWDTETGACVRALSPGKLPLCVQAHPAEANAHVCLVGCSDKKIYQFDMRTGEIEQEYNEHLGGVNSITFIDDDRRIVSTSDDKTLRVWDFGIPVVIKYIADEGMHSIPAVAQHPNRRWLVGQSLDNQLVVVSASDKVKLNRNKRFVGHLVAGYACRPAFSPDGHFVSSGDADGRLWFWDWRTSRVLGKLKCHDSVLIDHVWHPHETSKVITCSWDGLIKLWD